MDWIRSVVGVGVGFAIFVIGSYMPRSAVAGDHTLTAGLVVGAIGYGAVFAALGGLAAASIAGRRQVTHGVALAALIAVAALVHPWLEPGSGPRWLDLGAAFGMAPAAVLAAWARGRVHPS
jgi:hypothetical protein